MIKKAAAQISPIMRELSGYIAEALGKPLPPAVVEKAKHHILDTIAAMISGSRLAPGRKAIGYVRTLGGVRESLVIGSRIVTSAVNGPWPTACSPTPTRPTTRTRRR